MVVVAFNGGLGLLETDVVEPCKRGSVDVSDVVVRNQEQLLQQHIDNSVKQAPPSKLKGVTQLQKLCYTTKLYCTTFNKTKEQLGFKGFQFRN